jgi:hypothetical protein
MCGKDGFKGVIHISFGIDGRRAEKGGVGSRQAAPTTSQVSPIGDLPLVLQLPNARRIRLFVFQRTPLARTALEEDVLGVVDVEEEGGEGQVAAFVVSEETASIASSSMGSYREE